MCDGWTRGHVLTHLARNADGIAATLSGALRGEIVPRYPNGDAGRTADIEAGASRSTAELLADVAESAERLDRVFGAVAEADAWDVPTDGGRVTGDWVSRRLCEVEVHRVALAGAYGPDRWPAALIGDLLPLLVDQLAKRADESLHVVVTDGSVVPALAGRTWTIGSREPIEVRGPDWALLAWLTGRGQLATDVLGEAPTLLPWR